VIHSRLNTSKTSWHATDEVAAALRDGRPVVALESTILTHGLAREPRAMSAKFVKAFPKWDVNRPANLAAALGAEAAVRASGAVPATIAIIDGRVSVGLTAVQLEQFCANDGASKVSLRDLGSAIAHQRTGGTTVASTSCIAAMSGISLFATGGIGGVHRGWSKTLDFSADLMAIATHPVLVVSAGAKILLDLPATLEALETLGIPTLGFGSRFFPRFTVSPDQNLLLPDQVQDAAEAARVVAAHWSVRPSCGALLMQACPETFALPAEQTEHALATAMIDAQAMGIRGAATTPFLLARLASSGEGQEVVEANLALLFANASLAAKVACAMSD